MKSEIGDYCNKIVNIYNTTFIYNTLLITTIDIA